MITLVLGGARSGKSGFAEELAYKKGGEEVIYLATAEPGDEEMKERIEKHKNNRPSTWETIEEPYHIAEEISDIAGNKTILLDCITILVSNWLLKENKMEAKSKSKKATSVDKNNYSKKEDEIMEQIKDIVDIADRKELDLIIVSNEVGLGLVPSYKSGRYYRDITGRVNQYLAQKSNEVYFSIAGLQVNIKDLAVDL